MKRILSGLLILYFCAAAASAVPQYLNYQGVLRDDQGRLVTGTKSLTFKLYDSAAGATPLWQMASPEVVVSNGLYSAKLGPLSYSDLASGSRWLEVTVGTETMSPRLELLASAYAMAAGSAETAASLGGFTAAATGSGSFIPVTTGGKLDSSVIPASGTGGNADTVDSFHANATATAGQILPLDSNKQLKGMSVSAEAASGYALFSVGRVGIKAGGQGISGNPETTPCGIATIPNNGNEVDVYNSNITDNSLIFLTQGPSAASAAIDHGGVYVKEKVAGRFRIRTGDGALIGPTTVSVYYLIIN